MFPLRTEADYIRDLTEFRTEALFPLLKFANRKSCDKKIIKKSAKHVDLHAVKGLPG